MLTLVLANYSLSQLQDSLWLTIKQPSSSHRGVEQGFYTIP